MPIIDFSADSTGFRPLNTIDLYGETEPNGVRVANCMVNLKPIVPVSDLVLVLTFDLEGNPFEEGNDVRIQYHYTNKSDEDIEDIISTFIVTTPNPNAEDGTGLNQVTLLVIGETNNTDEVIYLLTAEDELRGYITIEAYGTGTRSVTLNPIVSNTVNLQVP